MIRKLIIRFTLFASSCMPACGVWLAARGIPINQINSFTDENHFFQFAIQIHLSTRTQFSLVGDRKKKRLTGEPLFFIRRRVLGESCQFGLKSLSYWHNFEPTEISRKIAESEPQGLIMRGSSFL